MQNGQRPRAASRNFASHAGFGTSDSASPGQKFTFQQGISWYAAAFPEKDRVSTKRSLAALLFLLFSTACWPQTQSPPQAKPCVDLTLSPSEGESHNLMGGITEAAERMGGVRPSQTVDTQQTVCPLTNREKLNVFFKDSYSPVNVVVAAFNAGIWQASQTSKEGYGQGWNAYGSRFGAAFADSESSDFFGEFLFPSLFHQDPRYFRLRDGPVVRRGVYAVTRILVTHGDNGKHQFNFSEFLGGFASAGVSNLYYPSDQRSASDVVYRAGLGFATDAGWNLLKEFGPDISRALFHKKDKSTKKDAGHFENVPRPSKD